MPRDPVLPYPHYKCRCGHRFEEALGRWGCPNCEGENPARLIEKQSKESKPCRIKPSLK